MRRSRSVLLHAMLLLALLQGIATKIDAQDPATSIDASCARVNTINDVCDVQSTCSRCVRADGCAFDLRLLACVAAPEKGQPLYQSSSNALLNRTSYTYCADTDPLCGACSVSMANPLCEGEGSCICRSMCNILKPMQTVCYQQRQGYMMYMAIAAMAIVMPLIVLAQRRCARSRMSGSGDDDTRANLRRQLFLQQHERERERERQRPPSALALQLETWRSHRDEHKIEVERLELKNCYVIMENSNDQPVVGAVVSDHHRGERDDRGISATAPAGQIVSSATTIHDRIVQNSEAPQAATARPDSRTAQL